MGSISVFAPVDTLRQIHGATLERLGFGPAEYAYRIVALSARWRLRIYEGAPSGPPLLIVAAPIKRPYIWDLADQVSPVRHCLRRRLRVYLLEWMPPVPGDPDAGLDNYAGRSISEAVASVAQQGGAKPFLMGHSLGGTLAAIFAASDPASVRGLVLLSAPLSFEAGSYRFREAIVAMVPPTSLAAIEIIPGSLLSQLSAMASPETFLWSRLVDLAFSIGDPRALTLHARVARWALDEFPLLGRLVREIFEWLYRENRLCAGTLQIGDKVLRPSSLKLPLLAVANTRDAIAPLSSIAPYIEAMPRGYARLIEYPGETGVGMQHLAALIGARAHATVWPAIISWLHAQT
jgi:polyhydroxyalkanoate synthase